MEELCSPQVSGPPCLPDLTHLRLCFSTGLLGPAPGAHLEDGRLEPQQEAGRSGPTVGVACGFPGVTRLSNETERNLVH